MPIFTPTPPKLPRKATEPKGSVKEYKSKLVKPSIRRRPLEDDVEAYGDKLFEAAYVPKKTVYVTFFTKLVNNVGISRCRKYAIEYIPFHHEIVVELEREEDDKGEKEIRTWVEAWNLFYFADVQSPLMAFNPTLDKEYVIPKEKATESIIEAATLRVITDKIVEIEIKDQLKNKEVVEEILTESEATNEPASTEANIGSENNRETANKNSSDSGTVSEDIAEEAKIENREEISIEEKSEEAEAGILQQEIS